MTSEQRPLVTRRGLLTAGAGLALGAGGTELGNALTGDSSSAPGADLASPGEELMVEHGVLKRVLLAYRAMSERLTGGQPLAAGPVIDAAQIIADYVESFHEGLEEGYVFPRVAHIQPGLVRTLLIQHDRGRHLTAAIRTTAAGDLHRAATRAALAANLAAFVRMYEPHEAWEDTVIYPALRATTPPRTLDQLGARFAELETKQYGDDALAHILGRVDGIEQQLGIHDLAAFTPRDG